MQHGSSNVRLVALVLQLWFHLSQSTCVCVVSVSAWLHFGEVARCNIGH